MDVYPPEYVIHNVPLLILSGLTSTAKVEDQITTPLSFASGPKLVSEQSAVTGTAADELLDIFHEFNVNDVPWNNRPGRGKMGTMAFRIRTTGKVG